MENYVARTFCTAESQLSGPLGTRGVRRSDGYLNPTGRMLMKRCVTGRILMKRCVTGRS